MNWSNNLTIRAKVIGAFALALVVTCALGVFAMMKLSAVNDSTVEIASNYLTAQTQLGLMNGSSMRFRQLEAAHIFAVTIEQKQHEEATAGAELADLQRAWNVYAPTVDAGAERELADQIPPLWTRYLELHRELVALSRAHKDDEAKRFYVGEMRTVFNEYYGTLHKLIDHQIKGGNEEAASAAGVYT